MVSVPVPVVASASFFVNDQAVESLKARLLTATTGVSQDKYIKMLG